MAVLLNTQNIVSGTEYVSQGLGGEEQKDTSDVNAALIS